MTVVEETAGRVIGTPMLRREDPALLFVRVDRRGERPGRLAADVDDGRTGGDQNEPVGDGGLVIEVAPAVGERIGSDVDDAHDGGEPHRRQFTQAG